MIYFIKVGNRRKFGGSYKNERGRTFIVVSSVYSENFWSICYLLKEEYNVKLNSYSDFRTYYLWNSCKFSQWFSPWRQKWWGGWSNFSAPRWAWIRIWGIPQEEKPKSKILSRFLDVWWRSWQNPGNHITYLC